MKIWQIPDGIIVSTDAGIIRLSKYESYELFAWLSDHRDWLRNKDDELNSISDILNVTDEQRLQALANGPQEPWLEDCEHCGGAHLLGTVDMCPLNPNRPAWVKHLEAHS